MITVAEIATIYLGAVSKADFPPFVTYGDVILDLDGVFECLFDLRLRYGE